MSSTVGWVVVLCNNSKNLPVEAMEISSYGLSSPGSAVTLHSCGASSLWVPEARFGPLATTKDGGFSTAAPVWSSERLFPTNADKERTLFNYPLYIHNYTAQNICPALFFPWLFWIRLFWSERWYAFQFKNKVSIWVTRKGCLPLPTFLGFFLGCIHSVWHWLLYQLLLDRTSYWRFKFPRSE